MTSKEQRRMKWPEARRRGTQGNITKGVRGTPMEQRIGKDKRKGKSRHARPEKKQTRQQREEKRVVEGRQSKREQARKDTRKRRKSKG
jgi:hypothetical protein